MRSETMMGKRSETMWGMGSEMMMGKRSETVWGMRSEMMMGRASPNFSPGTRKCRLLGCPAFGAGHCRGSCTKRIISPKTPFYSEF